MVARLQLLQHEVLLQFECRRSLLHKIRARDCLSWRLQYIFDSNEAQKHCTYSDLTYLHDTAGDIADSTNWQQYDRQSIANRNADDVTCEHNEWILIRHALRYIAKLAEALQLRPAPDTPKLRILVEDLSETMVI